MPKTKVTCILNYFTSKGPSIASVKMRKQRRNLQLGRTMAKVPLFLAKEIKSVVDSFNTSSQATQGQWYQRQLLPFSLAEELESRYLSLRN